MSDGMGRELAYLSSHATNRYFIPNWGNIIEKTNNLSEIIRNFAASIVESWLLEFCNT